MLLSFPLLCLLELLERAGSLTCSYRGPFFYLGYMQYVLFNVSNLGYLQQSVDALVEGIAEAIRRAHESIQSGDIYLR